MRYPITEGETASYPVTFSNASWALPDVAVTSRSRAQGRANIRHDKGQGGRTITIQAGPPQGIELVVTRPE